MKKTTTSFILFLLFVTSAVAQQHQDCATAISVCYGDIGEEAYTGSGYAPNEINSHISCLGNGEENSVWFNYKVATSGMLNFSIIPYTASNDYDWAVFNITNSECANIFTDTALAVSCNFAPTPGATGPNGGSGPQERPEIPVIAGETYVIVVTNFSISNQNGFQINFTHSTSSFACTADINEESTNVSQVYPNPSDGKFNIALSQVFEDVGIRIFSSEGKLVQEITRSKTDFVGLDLTVIPGIYFIEIQCGNTKCVQKMAVRP